MKDSCQSSIPYDVLEGNMDWLINKYRSKGLAKNDLKKSRSLFRVCFGKQKPLRRDRDETMCEYNM